MKTATTGVVRFLDDNLALEIFDDNLALEVSKSKVVFSFIILAEGMAARQEGGALSFFHVTNINEYQ